MAEYAHLPLKRIEGTLPRRKHGFGKAPKRDAGVHGAAVAQRIDESLTSYGSLPKIEGIDPALILKITASTLIDEDEWRKLGMVLLSVDGDNSVVLFANDKTLSEFKRKVEAYQGELPLGQKSPQYASLIAAIDGVSLLAAADRIGPSLAIEQGSSTEVLEHAATQVLDVELHFPPERADAEIFLYRLEQVVEGKGGRVLSRYIGMELLLARVEVAGPALVAALNLPEVAKIDLPPSPDFLHDDVADVDLSTVNPGSPPPADAVTIGIIDTGVNFGHPLLQASEAGAISFDPSGDIGDGEKGHGTQVASIAAFGNIAERISQDNFDHDFKIASARVLDDEGRFLQGRTLPDLMEEAIRTLHGQFDCRIFNISLGDERRAYLGGRVDVWSAALDTLSRDLDVVIVVSSGNRKDFTAHRDKVSAAYPQLLLEDASRLIPPATAALAITVGAISHSNGIDEADAEYVGVRPISEAFEPSPFTRSGPGTRGMTKPDLVDIGGTAVWDGPSQAIVTGSLKAAAGIWAFSHKPVERLFVSRSGTSFAAPAVANKAAYILRTFPGASANLIRALLGLSGSMPKPERPRAAGLSAKELASICGHGVSDVRHAATSDDSRVVLYAEDEIEIDHFAIFEVPIPRDFQTRKGDREIRVSLAFDPPVRHTRVDYVGTTMGWRLLRGSTEQEVRDRFRKWEKEEGTPPDFEGKYVCSTTPGPEMREHGTLQVGTYTGKADISVYGDRYFVAVWCLRRWAPAKLATQKFALAVQLRHENVTDLYAVLRQPIKV